MYSIRGTKKLLDRVGIDSGDEGPATTALKNWYANVLFWKPQVVILVNEQTRMPLFVPFAPSDGLGARIPEYVVELLDSYELDGSFIEHERREMSKFRYTRTESRSVLGTMNEFVQMATRMNDLHRPLDLLSLSRWMAETPCLVNASNAIWPVDEVRLTANRWLSEQKLNE